MYHRIVKFLPLAVCLLIALLLIGYAVISAGAETVGGYISGDTDGDGEVTVIDATLIQRKLADLPVSTFRSEAADVSGDGLDITDATMIQRYLADYDVPFSIGKMVPVAATKDPYELPLIPV